MVPKSRSGCARKESDTRAHCRDHAVGIGLLGSDWSGPTLERRTADQKRFPLQDGPFLLLGGWVVSVTVFSVEHCEGLYVECGKCEKMIVWSSSSWKLQDKLQAFASEYMRNNIATRQEQ